MKLLLDTHILIWWFDDDPQLKPRFRQLLADPKNRVLVSMASLWEIAIKRQIGKLHVSAPDVAARLAEQDFAVLPMTLDHFAAVETLPRHHGDPFDHLLFVQARIEKAVLVTVDADMARYGVPCIGVA